MTTERVRFHAIDAFAGLRWASLLLLGLGLTSVHLKAATYYTAPSGSDTNSGSLASPWRTVQKAANTLMPGDTVLVRAGIYPERVTTVRSGAAETNRITFQGDGVVVMKGWIINHAFITVQGFEITGHSAASVLDAHVRVNSGGSHFALLNCAVRDAIQVTRPDMMFHSSSNAITSATGGFLAAGFAPGQSLYVGAATNGLTIANSGLSTITGATDTAITVAPGLSDQGPVFAYLSASLIYGLNLHSATEGCVIRSNTFHNLGYDTWLITGTSHLLEDNVIEQANGWDAMHFGGTNHIFRRNVIKSSPLLVYQNSPDAMENYQVPYSRVTFSNNVVYGFAGVLVSQKAPYNMPGLLISHNRLYS